MASFTQAGLGKLKIGEAIWYMEYKKLPVDITWNDEERATIDIICDACEKRYVILTNDISNLELCSFCGHYLEVETEDMDESEEDSWD